MYKKKIRTIKKIHAIRWKEGSGTIMFYISMMCIIALSCIMFMEFSRVFSNTGKTQIYADIIADGAACAGDNGWNLDKDKAEEAKDQLQELNEKNFNDTEVRISFSKTDAEGNIVDGTEDEDNTIDAVAKIDTRTIVSGSKLKTSKSASTKIITSGGADIVVEAYRHTWQYSQRNNTDSQTQYMWGGGHQSDDMSWEQYADCSGFVSGVFRKCGYYIPCWATTGNMELMGTLVGEGSSAYENAVPGDIILFWWSRTGGTSDHVAIYAGKKNGIHYMVHCSGNRQNATIETAGRGESRGAIFVPASTSASRIMVRHLVNSNGDIEDTPERSVHGLTGDESIIYNALSDFGYSDVCIAAIMGNWSVESGCCPISKEGRYGGNSDPVNIQYAEMINQGLITKDQFVYEGRGLRHSGSEGYGLAQWTTTDWSRPYEDRKAKLWDYAQQRNSRVTDINVQIAYAINEFQTSHPQIDGQEFRLKTSVDDATKYFLRWYEGSTSLMMLRERQIAANTFYRIFTSIP